MELLRDYCDSLSPESEYLAESIFPGAGSSLNHNVAIRLNAVESELKERSFKGFTPYLLTCTTYRCAHTRQTHQTRAAFLMVNIGENGHAKVLGPYQDDWMNRAVALVHPGLIVVD